MAKPIKSVVIVGGGTAGWLTAGTIAAEHQANSPTGVEVILIESPDVSPIGVGEGTWPTMRETLRKMGISETEFIRECDASFKQGSKFSGWMTGAADDHYYHPFSLPQDYTNINLVPMWQAAGHGASFAETVCFQVPVCEAGLAPKQITTPEYAAVANYAYHLDAGKFAVFLQKHCTNKLGVKHILDHVTGVKATTSGDIASVSSREHGDICGDLFIDCTGFASLLLGQHFEVPFVSRKDTLFIDRALAVQVPYASEDSPIASQTISTAQSAGWIWDIGLPSRRGVGHVYSSAHTTEEQAEAELRSYIEPALGKDAEAVEFRKISINPGHREQFWHKNCVAVGMAAGFLEPLEASALALVELSAAMISEQLPASRDTMDIVAKRFNEKFLYRWDRVIEFLKLHYVLTQRTDSDFWLDNCRAESIPAGLQESLALWREQPPWHNDFDRVDEIFPSASYQYVLYGMGFVSAARSTSRRSDNAQQAAKRFAESANKSKKMVAALPHNRELINKIKQYGLQKV